MVCKAMSDTVEIIEPTAIIEPRDAKTGRFVSGNNGGPGRKLGSRNRHGETFLRAFAEDFQRFGPEVIAKVRVEQPAVYLKIASDLLPKELQVELGRPGDFSILETADDVVAKIREEMGDRAADLLQQLIDGDVGE